LWHTSDSGGGERMFSQDIHRIAQSGQQEP
jgi:hypothetical protein